MPQRIWEKWKPGIIVYGGATALCCGLLFLVLQLWRANLSIPFVYRNDGLFTSMMIKSLADHGSYFYNPSLGAPYRMYLYDYPFTELIPLLALRLLAPLIHPYGLLLNLTFLLTFPLTTIITLTVFRQLGFRSAESVLCSLLYTFLPYHFLRGELHFFLSMYFLIPPTVLVIFWVGQTDLPKIRGRRRMIFSIAVCLAAAWMGVYYSFFSIMLILFAGILAAIRERNFARLKFPLLLAAIILGGAAAATVPDQVYWHTHGHNALASLRKPGESEFYGLKIAQLLLPITGHRMAALASLKNAYNQGLPNVNETDWSALGVLGSLGFLLLLAQLVVPIPLPGLQKLKDLAPLNLFALLLGTVGGFGALIAVCVSPQIRSYNRIGIFIAFFAFLGIAALLDALRPLFRGRHFAWYGLLALLLAFGIWDQTSPVFVPDYATIQAQYDNDEQFVKQIEATVPAQSMIFQLPYAQFPEAPAGRMGEYAHFRSYLHSRTLRWSFGAIKGRRTDAWQQEVTAAPLPKMISILRQVGFAGVTINGDNYADGGHDLSVQLGALLGTQPILSQDGSLIFFPFGGTTPHR